jgi:hypothetical protein
MSRRRLVIAVLLLGCVGWAARYLHDPPWVGGVTSGIREWRYDADGTRYRWTNGHATFYVPSRASEMTLPMRAGLASSDSTPVRADVSVDDRWLATIELNDPAAWKLPVFPLPANPRRSYRRVDVRVSRVVGYEMLGVQLGEPRYNLTR